MSWEAIAALASAATVVVLVATVIVAARQLSAAAGQIELLRRSNQFDGMLRIMAQFDSPEFIASRNFILTELDAKLEEPSFADFLQGISEKPWRPALGTLELLGVYIRFGYLDGGPFYYNLARTITNLWKHLRPLVEMERLVLDNPYLWKDTEWLAADVMRYADKWIADHPLPRPSTGEAFRPSDLLGHLPKKDG